MPFNDNGDKTYYPREEIAHPIKLKNIVENKSNIWKIHRFENNNFYAIWIPWFKKYKFFNDIISTESFYVLTERPALFYTFNEIIDELMILNNYKNINNSKYINNYDYKNNNEIINKIKQWLHKWWNTPFLITIPILYQNNSLYIINNILPYSNIDLKDYDKTDYLNVLLANKSYTIANGLTLLLAYHRLGLINANITHTVLDDFIYKNDLNIIQNVTDDWHTLYYGNLIPHIADFPAYYICTGPNFAHENVVDLFKSYFDFNLILSNIIPSVNVFTSPFSAMFPYFNTCLWKEFYKQNIWANISDNLNDIVIPDLVGFIHSILTTKKSWKFWCKNYNDLLISIQINYSTKEKLIYDLIQICSYYYIYGSHYFTRSLKSKVRNTFKMIIKSLDYDKKHIPNILVKSLLKYQLSERLFRLGHPEPKTVIEIPYAFMKDIFEIYSLSESFKLYNKNDYYIISKNINIIQIIYSDVIVSTYAIIQLENGELINAPSNLLINNIPEVINNNENMNDNMNGNNVNDMNANNVNDNVNDNEDDNDDMNNVLFITRYSINRSIMMIFKDSIRNSYTNIFYNKYIYKHIITRLCAIYKGFGMYKDISEATLYNSNTVGTLFIEFLKNNKEYLII
jgi:hypothetical protein